MWRLGIVTAAALAFPQAFTFTIGSPVASQDSRSKLAAFVFRMESCGDVAKAQVGGTAEGVVHGARTSVAHSEHRGRIVERGSSRRNRLV